MTRARARGEREAVDEIVYAWRGACFGRMSPAPSALAALASVPKRLRASPGPRPLEAKPRPAHYSARHRYRLAGVCVGVHENDIIIGKSSSESIPALVTGVPRKFVCGPPRYSAP